MSVTEPRLHSDTGIRLSGILLGLAAVWLVDRPLPELPQAEEGAVVEEDRPDRALGAAVEVEVAVA